MSNKLPWDIKQECLWIVRGYDRRVKQYIAQQQDIIDAGGENYVMYRHVEGNKFEERRAIMPHANNTGRPIEDRQAQLEAIEHFPETLKMRAVEYARLRIGLDCGSKEERQRLTNGIILNCECGRMYPFQYLNLPDFSDSDFHRRKDAFLRDIAKYMHYI